MTSSRGHLIRSNTMGRMRDEQLKTVVMSELDEVLRFMLKRYHK